MGMITIKTITTAISMIPSVEPTSSTASGYCAGGSAGSNVIDKVSFSSDGNATDVGDLTVGRNACTAGQQV